MLAGSKYGETEEGKSINKEYEGDEIADRGKRAVDGRSGSRR